MLTFGQQCNIIQAGGQKYMPMTPREMVRLLKKYGFEEVRQNGTSHLQMKNPITGKQTTIPMHNRDLGKGLEQAILKQAGIEKDR